MLLDDKRGSETSYKAFYIIIRTFTSHWTDAAVVAATAVYIIPELLIDGTAVCVNLNTLLLRQLEFVVTVPLFIRKYSVYIYLVSHFIYVYIYNKSMLHTLLLLFSRSFVRSRTPRLMVLNSLQSDVVSRAKNLTTCHCIVNVYYYYHIRVVKRIGYSVLPWEKVGLIDTCRCEICLL